jgi:hypothetical protein
MTTAAMERDVKTSSGTMLPNFVGIGAQRAATTWLYSCLKEHPQIYLAPQKEVHFFDEKFEKGLEWYADQFRDYAQQPVLGEITPNYLDSEVAVPRMAQVIPDARLVVILRDPVQRAFSAYKLFRDQHYAEMTFQEACESSPYLIRLGMYAAQIERVFSHYSRQNVRVLLYEDIQTKADEVLASIYGFLNVDPSFKPTASRKVYNSVVFPRAQATLDHLGLGWMVRTMKETRVGEWIKRRQAFNRSPGAATLDENFATSLKGTFRGDVLRLQQLIQRDLSAWL